MADNFTNLIRYSSRCELDFDKDKKHFFGIPDGQRPRLEALVNQFDGLEIEFNDNVYPKIDGSPDSSFEGSVVSLCSSVRLGAGLYAKVTGREHVHAGLPMEDWKVDGRVSVVFARFSQWTSSLKKEIWEISAKQNRMIGIIFDDETASNAIFQSSFWLFAKEGEYSNGRINCVYPNRPIDEVHDGFLSIFGAQASKDNVRCAISSGSALLFLHSHGDGLDLKLPNDMALCTAVEGRKSLLLGQYEPACVQQRRCTKLGVPIYGSSLHRHFVPASDVSAYIAIFDACLFGRVNGSILPPQFHVLNLLLRKGLCGCVVADSEISLGSEANSLFLVQQLLSGKPVGQAVSDFNHSSAGEQFGKVLFLFGDPSLRVPRKLLRTKDTSQNESTEVANRSMVERRAESKKHKLNYFEAMDRALCANGEKTSVAKKLSSPESSDVPSAENSHALQQHGLLFGKNVMIWSNFLEIMAGPQRGRCQICGGRDKLHKVGMYSKTYRYIKICEICEITMDAPVRFKNAAPFLTLSKDKILVPYDTTLRKAAIKIWTDRYCEPEFQIIGDSEMRQGSAKLQLKLNFGSPVFVALIMQFQSDYATFAFRSGISSFPRQLCPPNIYKPIEFPK